MQIVRLAFFAIKGLVFIYDDIPTSKLKEEKLIVKLSFSKLS